MFFDNFNVSAHVFLCLGVLEKSRSPIRNEARKEGLDRLLSKVRAAEARLKKVPQAN
jgi:hypothetical protein